MGAPDPPPEILLLILQDLDMESLLSLRGINRAWRFAASYAAANIVQRELPASFMVKYNPDPPPSIPGPP
jgi:hypothetical protein